MSKVFETAIDIAIGNISEGYSLNTVEDLNIRDLLHRYMESRKEIKLEELDLISYSIASHLGTICFVNGILNILGISIVDLRKFNRDDVRDVLNRLTSRKTVDSSLLKRCDIILAILEEIEQSKTILKKTRSYQLMRILLIMVIMRNYLGAGLVAQFLLNQMEVC